MKEDVSIKNGDGNKLEVKDFVVGIVCNGKFIKWKKFVIKVFLKVNVFLEIIVFCFCFFCRN